MYYFNIFIKCLSTQDVLLPFAFGQASGYQWSQNGNEEWRKNGGNSETTGTAGKGRIWELTGVI